MTIKEAVKAARANTPVIYESPMEGPILYGRISSIRKDFALRSDVAHGKEPESYALELVSMRGARSVCSVAPERVRIATGEELRDLRHYIGSTKTPEVRPELICDELKGEYNGQPKL